MNLFLIENILNLEISSEIKERALSFLKSYNNVLKINPNNITINADNKLKINFTKNNEILILFFEESINNDGWAYYKLDKNTVVIYNVLDNIDSCAEFINYSQKFL